MRRNASQQDWLCVICDRRPFRVGRVFCSRHICMRLTWSSEIGELCERQPQCKCGEEICHMSSTNVAPLIVKCLFVPNNSSIYIKYQTKVCLFLPVHFRPHQSSPLPPLTENHHCHLIPSQHGQRSTNQAPRNIDLDQHDGLMLKSRTRTDRGLSERQKLIG